MSDILVPQGIMRPDGPFDLPANELDLTTNVQDLFGGTVDLGTDGECTLRWQRSGRFIEAQEAASGLIPATVLPIVTVPGYHPPHQPPTGRR